MKPASITSIPQNSTAKLVFKEKLWNKIKNPIQKEAFAIRIIPYIKISFGLTGDTNKKFTSLISNMTLPDESPFPINITIYINISIKTIPFNQKISTLFCEGTVLVMESIIKPVILRMTMIHNINLAGFLKTSRKVFFELITSMYIRLFIE